MRAFISVIAIAAVASAIGCAARADPLTLQDTIPNPSPNDNDLFGQSVSLSGGRALVGAQLDDTSGTDSGRAYLFDAATGALLQTFPNPNPAGLPASAPSDAFGLSVSLSGNLALIGAQNEDPSATTVNAGAAYLFNATTGTLLRTFTNPGTAPIAGDNFGHAVAVSGNHALISATLDDTGATNAGDAYLFDTTTGALLQTFLNPLPGSNDNFGFDVALFGNRALISTINDDTANTNAGAAYLFDTDTGTLLHTFLNPTPETNNVFGNNDNFGFAVALSATMALIGAPNDGVNGFQNGVAYLYDLTTFDLLHTLVIPTPFTSDSAEFLGSDVALSGNCALAGAPFRNKGAATSQKDLGAAFLYDAKTGAFLQEVDDPDPHSNDRFGFSVALDGCDALIGAQTDLVGTIRPGQVFFYEGPAPVPEPDSIILVSLGLAGMGYLWRRRNCPIPVTRG